MIDIKFIDLFSGIGGFRQGFDEHGFECVFSSEIDKYAQDIYEYNFSCRPHGDITTIDAKDIPGFDILLAGFPCQPFSRAGKQKGFNDIRGTLFFDVIRIIKYHTPKIIVLENVKNLMTHDKGRTLNVILSSLSELGYNVSWEILNAADFGVPQSRNRIVIVASLGDKTFDFIHIQRLKRNNMHSILEDSSDFEYLDDKEFTLIGNPKLQVSGLIFTGYRNKTLRLNGVKKNTSHLSRAHRQPNRIYSSEGIHPTLSAQESSGRYFIQHGSRVRKLTMLECYRMMGFPDSFIKSGSNLNQYKVIGNSIVIPMVSAVAREIKNQFF